MRSLPHTSMNALPLPVETTATDSPWRAAVTIVIVSWIVVLAMFWGTAASVVATWRTSSFNHCYLIVPIAAYLVWSQRERLTGLTPSPNLWGLPLLAVVGFGWLLGTLADVLVVQQVALVAMLEALTWTALGPHVFLALLFPLGFLWFAVPLGEVFIPPLQDFTAAFAARAVELSGVPTLLEGRILSVPSGSWEVAEACSGIRYLIASLVVGYLYAGLVYRSWTRRLGFLALCIVVPILANAVRAYGIVMLGHLSGNRLARGVDHVIYGWVFFSAVTMLLLWLGSRWPERDADTERPRPPELGCSPITANGGGHPVRAIALTVASGVALVALAPVSAWVMLNRVHTPTVVRLTAPPVSPPWTQLGEYTGNWTPQFVGTDADILATFTAGAQPVHLYIGYYVHERQGTELIAWGNTVTVKGLWTRITEGDRYVTVDGRALRVRETIMRSSDGRTRLVWMWYWTGGEFTSSPYYAKFLQAKTRLLLGSEATAVIAVGADCALDCTRAAATMQDFLRHSASLQSTLQSFSESMPRVAR